MTLGRILAGLVVHIAIHFPLLGLFGLDTDGLVSRPADVAPHTDGTPEHVIDARRMTVVHDADQHVILLQVPGTTHFVLKPRADDLRSAAAAEEELLACLRGTVRRRE